MNLKKIKPIPVATDMLDEHFEELEFLWELREKHQFALHWDLNDLADIESRAETHLRALLEGGSYPIRLARLALKSGDPALVTAACFVLNGRGCGEEESIIQALKHGREETLAGLKTGLRHLSDLSPYRDALDGMLRLDDTFRQAIALDILSHHGIAVTPDWERLLGSEEPRTRRMTIEAMVRCDSPWDRQLLEKTLREEEAPLRRTALRTSAMLGLSGLADVCRELARSGSEKAGEAVLFLGILGDRTDMDALLKAARVSGLAPFAVEGLGIMGCIQAIPDLIDFMNYEDIALDAGRAFWRLTAIDDIDGDQLTRPPDDLSLLQMDFWDPEPLPDPARAQTVWEGNEARYDLTDTWQLGQSVSRPEAMWKPLPLAVRRDLLLRMRAHQPAIFSGLDLEQRVDLQLRHKSDP